ncbi:AER014Wp [Eremothecium gossypii ATCC 10895]|uniref:N-(5'-phosphoribosyl)anthranilate isomerase n=1 Tax=Eremothecium gossypii (strain ATCC 10895 / CBS 109.51 / FGSC 9923 / NRRL Y-1056) TaxID=284811 RepID=TRPF_EREGS|nr:AER014Wp [Eremothecium gossypii ATCC 10895]Q757J9.1 RecName: Full=N-(5'-phosphoribosyl)anthranilate isomerase; Short=PRAI [Eremothecium gossypii ATCC 10895]AAS52698.1 AER014Wp [Eremothecium gossypii ATCC 10895]AEY97003.1 FAER014Wp [Eremothecium gossypii FDAG1]
MVVAKVCGVRDAGAAAAAAAAGAGFVGMVCVPGRRRTVGREEARAIAAAVRGAPGTRLVGVFQDQAPEEVLRLQRELGLDAVQLHGAEDWAAFRAQLPASTLLIKSFVFPRDCEAALAMHRAARGRNCMVLFDAAGGGSGARLDWAALAAWGAAHADVQFMLAGGLTPANVAEAARLPGVVAVDVSSGVETGGAKDGNKIRQFVENAKGI